MVRPEFRFTRRMIYDLKRQYPCALGLYQKSTTTDLKTGAKTVTQTVVTIQKGIVLPDKAVRQNGHPGDLRPFQYGGLFDSRTRRFLVDNRDIPSGFSIDLNMEIVYQHRRYSAKNIAQFEQGEAVLITAEWLEGTPTNEVFNMFVTDRLIFTEVTTP